MEQTRVERNKDEKKSSQPSDFSVVDDVSYFTTISDITASLTELLATIHDSKLQTIVEGLISTIPLLENRVDSVAQLRYVLKDIQTERSPAEKKGTGEVIGVLEQSISMLQPGSSLTVNTEDHFYDLTLEGIDHSASNSSSSSSASSHTTSTDTITFPEFAGYIVITGNPDEENDKDAKFTAALAQIRDICRRSNEESLNTILAQFKEEVASFQELLETILEKYEEDIGQQNDENTQAEVQATIRKVIQLFDCCIKLSELYRTQQRTYDVELLSLHATFQDNVVKLRSLIPTTTAPSTTASTVPDSKQDETIIPKFTDYLTPTKKKKGHTFTDILTQIRVSCLATLPDESGQRLLIYLLMQFKAESMLFISTLDTIIEQYRCSTEQQDDSNMFNEIAILSQKVRQLHQCCGQLNQIHQQRLGASDNGLTNLQTYLHGGINKLNLLVGLPISSVLSSDEMGSPPTSTSTSADFKLPPAPQTQSSRLTTAESTSASNSSNSSSFLSVLSWSPRLFDEATRAASNSTVSSSSTSSSTSTSSTQPSNTEETTESTQDQSGSRFS